MISLNRKINIIKQDIAHCENELYLVDCGVRKRLGKKKLMEIIAAKKAEIRAIKASKKKSEKFTNPTLLQK